MREKKTNNMKIPGINLQGESYIKSTSERPFLTAISPCSLRTDQMKGDFKVLKDEAQFILVTPTKRQEVSYHVMIIYYSSNDRG